MAGYSRVEGADAGSRGAGHRLALTRQEGLYYSAYGLALRAAVARLPAFKRGPDVRVSRQSCLIALRCSAARKPGAYIPCTPVRRFAPHPSLSLGAALRGTLRAFYVEAT
jgi:hypothetical protein